MPNNISEWVDYIQGLHSREIDLNLDRVREVYQRLRPEGIKFNVIIVAGTNGKGSTCELLTSIYDAAGFSTGKYTSPHIRLFNERFNINRKNVSDDELLTVFSRVEEARGLTGLTYFEFGTLVAIDLFAEAKVDVAIMEVGLGGRLDAVNILDADISIVTSISIDHTDWLGDDVSQIALEKVAVSRANKPCVIGMTKPPESMLDYCKHNKIPSFRLGLDFNYNFDISLSDVNSKAWEWVSEDTIIKTLPLPFSQSGVQLENASVALKTIDLMQPHLPVEVSAIAKGITHAQVEARCQTVSDFPAIIIDVAHNQASVNRLAEFVRNLNVTGKVYAICGMLKDKEIKQSLEFLLDVIDEWNFVNIDHPRGSNAADLETIFHDLRAIHNANSKMTSISDVSSHCHKDVDSAYSTIYKKLNNDDALIVFGSFFIVSDIMPFVSSNNDSDISQGEKLI